MKSFKTNARRAAVPALAVASVLALSACAGGGGSTPSGSGKVDGSTITIGTFSPLLSQFQAYADAYMKKYPNRTVKVVGVSEDFSKYQQILATQRISKSLPDIFFNVDFAANGFASNDIPLDLAPFLKEGKDGLKEDAFLPQFLAQYRPLNDPQQVTGLPVSADSNALVYNKTLFDQAGVDEYPTSDWTWDDYFRVAQEIQTKSGGKIYGTVPPGGDGGNSVAFAPILSAAGAKIYDADSNKTDIDSADALKGWADLLKFYGKASPAYTTTTGDPGYDFTSGKVAMGLASRANIAGFRDALKDYDWDVAEVPTINGKHVSGGGSYAMSIAKTSANPNAAWAFLAWFYQPDGGLELAQTPDGGGIIPPTLDGLEDGSWQNVDVPANMSVFAKTAKDAIMTVQMPGDAGTSLNNATKQAFQEILLSNADPQEAFAKAAESVNNALAQTAKK